MITNPGNGTTGMHCGPLHVAFHLWFCQPVWGTLSASSNHPLPSKFCNGIISTTKPSSTSTRSGCLNSLSTHSQFSEPAPCTCTSAASQERHLHRISPLSSQEAKDCDYSLQSSTVMQVTSLSESCHSEKETKI